MNLDQQANHNYVFQCDNENTGALTDMRTFIYIAKVL